MTLKFSTDFFTNFLKDNGDEIIQEKWNNEQAKFKKLFKKNESKSDAEKGPKKNKSAYNIYCSLNMKCLKEELPELDNKKLFAEIAKRWKIVKDSEDFKKYEALALEDKDRYNKEKGVFIGENLNEIKVKKPKNSYMMFCDDERKKISDLKGKELLVELGARWQVLKKNNTKRLEHFTNLAKADKDRYLNELKGGVEMVEEPIAVEEAVVVEEPVAVEEPKKKKQTAKKKVTTSKK